MTQYPELTKEELLSFLEDTLEDVVYDLSMCSTTQMCIIESEELDDEH